MSDSLFSTEDLSPAPAGATASGQISPSAPLATRLRPRNLAEFIGQQHILAPGKLLHRAIQADRISSIILYGPPGTGKTSLAEIIATATASRFERLSGVESNVADLRRVIASAANRLKTTGQKTILFIDEIHRFNKAQQDVLLPDVESGTIRLIGATTHNPFFYVNSPLVSRSQVFQLKPLGVEDIKMILQSALKDPERGLGQYAATITPEALNFLATACDGDARKALNALEIAVITTAPVEGRDVGADPIRDRQSRKSRLKPSLRDMRSKTGPTSTPPTSRQGPLMVDLAVAEESIQKKAVVYDGDEDEHYDTISAFIKSMRGSDPDAALYWLAKMVVAGEDPRFIARRIVILAAEDIGLADPQALIVAVAAHQAVDFIGWPEGELPLAEATVYCATAPKSNAAAKGIWGAKADIEAGRTLPVPQALKDTHYKGSQRLGHGQGYKYAHDFEGHVVAQDYLTEKRTYYTPSDQGFEVRVRERMEKWKQQLSKK